MARLDTLEEQIAFAIWLLVALGSLLANGCAIYLLLNKRSKKIADLLVLHLGITEFMGVAWNVILRPLNMFIPIKYASMVRTIGNQFFGAMFYQSVICISLDRLLVAALVLRYKVVITKRKLLLITILIWILSIMCAVIYGIWGIDSSLNRII